ncbi:MAG: hybrid sensor histidine kinase/response regulator, partial [Nitrospirae bacterium]
MSDDILQRLLISFQAEQRDHLEKIRSILDDLARSGKGPGPQLEEAFRRAHSLKGAARAVDLRQIETFAHCVETIFSRVRDGRLPLDKETIKTIRLVLDAIEDWVAAYFQKQTPAEPVKALDAVEALLGTEAMPRAAAKAAPPGEPAGTSHPAEEALTVSARSMEQLLEASDRMFVEASRQTVVTRKLAQVEFQVNALDAERDRVKRTRGQVLERHLDFVDRHVRSLKREVREIRQVHSRGTWGLQQAGEHLREEILRARMVPAEDVLQGFRKMVRDLARDEGKEVEFTAEGLGVQADRLVLQALKDPLMHLLRNAVTHGLEAPADRRSRGKEPAGAVRLRLREQGNLLRITVADDGRGIDWKTVAEYAVKRRFLSQPEAESVSPEALSRLLFLPGFSTIRMVTDLAGRGMGLSVVAETVKRLQGSVELRSEKNTGTTVEIAAPISVSTHRVLIVESAGQQFAIPAAALQGLIRVSIGQIETVEGR